MPRLFIAIDPPSDHRQQISKICTDIPGARWVKPEQLHLTMRFFGEVEDRLFRQIFEELAEIATDPLELKIKGVGQFPLRGSPRVLWVGIEKNDRLVRLRDKIETALGQVGFEPESRKFAPHITIARFKRPKASKKAVDHFMETHNRFELKPFQVKNFLLYSSRLTPGGAIHLQERSFKIP